MLNSSAQRGALSPKRRALLAALLKEQGVAVSRSEIVRQPRTTNQFPMSFAQQRLWFAEQLEPGSPVYNHASAIRLSGSLNQAALEQSLQEIVRRHEMLRTTFVADNGSLLQVIAESATLELPLVDLSGLPAAEREPEARRLAVAEAHRSFDLARGPLLRAVLVRLHPEGTRAEHILLLTIHHIITDAWSNSVLNRELAILYEAFAHDRPSPLPELPIQYADFAVWQRDYLTSAVREAQLTYWKQQLAGAPPLLELPCDHPRPTVQRYGGAYVPLVLSQSLSAALTALSQREGVTLFMTLLAAFKTLLYRYTGQHDLLVGSPNAGRNRSETEGLIGFFVNMLVLRTDLSGDPTFQELLQRVRATASGAYANQDLPFEQIVDELKPERNLSHSPIFQVAFALSNVPQAALQLSNLRIETLHFDAIVTSEFDITLFMAEAAGGLSGAFEYNAELFEATTIARMVDHFHMLLQSIIADPAQRISALPLLTPAERQQMLEAWNSPPTSAAPDHCVHQLFAAQAAQTPAAVALVCTDISGQIRELSYAELDRQANQLAHALQQRGIGPDARVGICAERSPELIVGLLAILKAGGAYVPLDPAYPQERLRFMIEDAQVRVLITQQALLDRLPEAQVPVLCLDLDWEAIDSQPHTPPVTGITSDHLAYVIYTSGSTGQPKGVMISHRSLCNFIATTTDEYAIGPGDRVLQFTSISWDTSVEELYPCLARGATLVLRPATMLDSMTTFLQTCHDLRITVLNLPTAVWHTVAASLSSLELPLPSTIRLLIIGGERVRPEHVKLWQANTGPGVRLLNTYGLAETTVEVTRYEVARAAQTRREIPIGRPFPSVQVFILDRQLQPVPIGVAGELYVAGPGLARGYLNRPDLTAERFIPHPFAQRAPELPGVRLYKTGDLARYRPDGNLEFLERADHQVKIRGFRIELGEIEAVLAQHPAVREAVVLAREDAGHGEKRLVAYVVEEQENKEQRNKEQFTENFPSPAAAGEGSRRSDGVRASSEGLSSNLRTFLAERLPSYMVPTVFVPLESFPFTPNGKVDHSALRAADQIRPEQRSSVPPRTAAEERLAEVWRQVLGIQQIGIHDNFFELGGDSIISIQIVDRARQAGLQLTPKQLFEHQTIEALAAVAGAAVAPTADQDVVTGPVPLTPIQCWFFAQALPEPQHWNQSVLLEAQAMLDSEALEQAAQQIVAHHDALRLRFRRTAAGWQQFNAPIEEQPVVVRVDLATLPADEQPAALERIAADWQASLDLTAGPLLRFVLFDLGANTPQRLLIIVNHLAIDGVSWRILLQDLQMAYQQRLRNEPIRLPLKTTSFKHWAERLVDYAQSPAIEEQLAYWQAVLPHPVERLPLDNPAGDTSEATAAIVSVALEAEETRALLHDVPHAYGTQINEVLLTALALACAQWTGSRRLLVELEGHGREDIFAEVDLSRTVGWFTTTFPILLDLADAHDLGDAVKQIKEQVRRVPQHGLGYGLLRYLSKNPAIVEQLQALPTPEISFNYLGQIDHALPESTPFQLVQEPAGPNRSLQGQRSCLLEINGLIVGGRLRLDWTYSGQVHDRSTIERLAGAYLEALRALIRHCQACATSSYTPSDFPLARLDQRRLDQIQSVGTPIEDIYPLAPMQRDILSYTLQHPASPAYVLQTSCVLHGALEIQAFKHAWQQALDRHPILRTGFQWQADAEPLQVVYSRVALPWRYDDLRGLGSAERTAWLEQFLNQDRECGFDLTQAPLMRVALIRVAEQSYQFIWSGHHLLLDGWSFQVLLGEVFGCYQALRQDRPIEVESAPAYRSYIAWLQQQSLAEAETFWRQALAGPAIAPVVLAAYDEANAGRHHEYHEQQTYLSATTTAALQQMARQHHLTLNTFVQGAWALLLGSYAHTDDVTFGVTISNRPPEVSGIDRLMGLCINTLPLRVQISGERSLLAWLKQVQEAQVAMQQYAYSPLEQVQTWAGSSTRPLFESVLRFQNYPMDAVAQHRGDAITIDQVRAVDVWPYPLSVVAFPGEQLLLSITYNGYAFDGATVAKMLADFQKLLEAMAAQIDQPLGALIAPSTRQSTVSAASGNR
ncbi:MAG TPA: amino acid adenylation domain-containing protein [Herpetosiphonaceae bacterium]